MANYVNADEMVKNLEGMKKLGYDAIAIDGMIKGLRESAVADAVEVVRCKDCRHYGGVVYGYSCRLHSTNNTRVDMRAEDFCSCGERKEEPENG